MTLRVRPVTAADARLLWEWTNDPETRRQSFSTEAVPWPDHLRWLEGKLADPRCHFYVVEDHDAPVGQVRFDRDDQGAAVISISIDPARRGQGIGTRAIGAAIARLRQDAPVVRVDAFIKQTNPASLRAFGAAGFRSSDSEADPAVARLSLRL